MATERPSRKELEAEVTVLRAELGSTVEALTHRLDVKSRVKDRVQAVSPALPVAAAVAVVLAVALVVWRRRS